jgi:hypothetical protein
MALQQQRSGSAAKREDDKPRNPETAWLRLAGIVYAWTDQREPITDRSWWQTPGGFARRIVAQPGGNPVMPQLLALTSSVQIPAPLSGMSPAV